MAISRRSMNVKVRALTRSRRRIDVKNQRLEMAGYRCEVCGRPIDNRCSLHHCLPVGAPDRNTVENVMVLCSVCHHELEKRPHHHGLLHLESDTRYDPDQAPDNPDGPAEE